MKDSKNTLYDYLKNEFMLSGSIQIADSEAKPSRFGDFRFHSYYGRVIEDINKLKIEDISIAYFIPSLLSFGDYDNSCAVERSNKRIFLEEFGGIEGVRELWGGYGSEGVAICLSADCTEFIETLEALESYPAIDDEDVFFLERELLDDAWNDCYKDELSELIESGGFNIDPDELRHKVDGRGLEFIESGGIAYIDTEGMMEEYKRELKEA